MGLIEQLISAMAVLMMIGVGVMLFVATDHAIQQVYRHSVEDELERKDTSQRALIDALKREIQE